jgi:hypothetical protein
VFSESVKPDDMGSSSQIYHNNSNNTVQQVQSEVFLPSTPIFNHDVDKDVHNTHIPTLEVDYDTIKQNGIIDSGRQDEKTECHFLQSLKLCFSWCCGLNDNQKDYTAVYLTKTENEDLNERSESILAHIKQRPLIKWLLNGNLIFILFVEIALFIVFTIPAKYTFLRE